MFEFLRRKATKKRRPPEKKLQGRIVPEADFELLKLIRSDMALGNIITLHPVEGKDVSKFEFTNAQILHDYYDMNNLDVLELSVYWVDERKP